MIDSSKMYQIVGMVTGMAHCIVDDPVKYANVISKIDKKIEESPEDSTLKIFKKICNDFLELRLTIANFDKNKDCKLLEF